MAAEWSLISWDKKDFPARPTAPFVPGHEIVGEIVAVGAKVSAEHGFVVGQRAGLGAQAGACGDCGYCSAGDENLCAKRKSTYASVWHCDADGKDYQHYGGYARRVRTHAAAVVPIPDGMPARVAAPLMCCGTTTYAPLARFGGLKAGAKVAVLGIGGLGHMAVRFAAAAGAHVTAVSSSESKRSLALGELGATAYLNSRDADAVAAAADTFDLVISTVSAAIDFGPLLRLTRRRGTFCFLGLPPGSTFPIPKDVLILKEIRVTGSIIGSRAEMLAMLRFAADKEAYPITEEFPYDQVNDAVARVADNAVRFRAVLRVSEDHPVASPRAKRVKK
jgi:uncharacterized zinc-type alcohol dehydrogenase-like protein